MPNSTFNDLELNDGRFKNYPELITSSLWIFVRRESKRPLHFHGGFVDQIPRQTIPRYTKKQEIVLDLFLGSGTTAFVAHELDRQCVGVDLTLHLDPAEFPNGVKVLQGNSANAKVIPQVQALMGQPCADYVILHPPYHNIIQFSDNQEDLSSCSSLTQFLEMFEQVANNAHELLASKRWATLVIGDIVARNNEAGYRKGELVPLGHLCGEIMRRAGFLQKAIIVKNITGNEQGSQGQTQNLWLYRHLKNGTQFFSHEYIYQFRRAK